VSLAAKIKVEPSPLSEAWSRIFVNKAQPDYFLRFFGRTGINARVVSFMRRIQSENQMGLDVNRFKDDEVVQENNGAVKPVRDRIDRPNFLGCMAWVGTGLL
jgi:hypothetical protein